MRNNFRRNAIEAIKGSNLEKAFEELFAHLDEDSPEYNDAVIIDYNFAELKNARHKNEISFGVYSVEKTKIAKRLLELINGLKKLEEVPLPSRKTLSNISLSYDIARTISFFNSEANYQARFQDLLFNINRKVHISVFWGMPGVGKTFLATKLGNDLFEEGKFGLVWFFNSDTYENILDGFESLALKLNIRFEAKDNTLIEKVKDHLESEREDWLLIYDNACDEGNSFSGIDYVAKNFFPRSSTAKKQIIITSTNRAWTRLFDSLNIQPWSKQDFSNFFISKQIECPPNLSLVLHEQFEGLPLAIVQAADYIDRCGISVEFFVEQLHKNKERLLKKGISIGDYPKGDLINAIILSYEKLEQALPIQAQLLMGMISFMAPDNIPIILINKRLESLADEIEGRFRSDNPLIQSYDCMEALGVLVQFSLIKRTGEDLYSIHRLVKEGVQFYLKKKAADYLLIQREIIKLFYTTYIPKGKFYLYVSRYMSLLTPHVIGALDSIVDFKQLETTTQKEVIVLQYRLGVYHFANSEKALGEEFFQQVKDNIRKCRDLSSEEEIDIILKRIELKSCYPAHFYPESAEQQTELTRLKGLLAYFQAKEIDQEAIVCFNRLGLTLLRNRQIEEAINCFQEALQLEKYDFLYGHLALAYLELGRIDEAVKHLEISNELAKQNDNNYVIGLNNISLGLIYGLQKRLTLSDKLLEDSIQVFQRLNEKRFLCYAIYPKLIFSIDNGQFAAREQELLKIFESFQKDLAEDLKYDLLYWALQLKLASFNNDEKMVHKAYTKFIEKENLLHYYPVESLAASIFLSNAIHFFEKKKYDKARFSIEKASFWAEKMVTFHFENELDYWKNKINNI